MGFLERVAERVSKAKGVEVTPQEIAEALSEVRLRVEKRRVVIEKGGSVVGELEEGDVISLKELNRRIAEEVASTIAVTKRIRGQ